MVEPFAFVNRFTNVECTKAFEQAGILKDVAQFSAEIDSQERKDPLKYVRAFLTQQLSRKNIKY